jgi:N-acetylneuraminic acid mutarotase
LVDNNSPVSLSSGVSTIFENKLYIFGGLLDKDQATNSMYSFDLEKKEWNEVKYQSDSKMGSFYGHSSTLLNGTWYIYGGYSLKNEEASSSFYTFDFKENNFKKIKSKGEKPPALMNFNMTNNNELIFIQGGTDNETTFSELYQFDPTYSRWSTIVSENDHIFSGGDVLFYQNSLIFYGGENEDLFSSFYIYKIGDKKIKVVEKDYLPNDRSFHKIFQHDNNLVVLFGKDSNGLCNNVLEAELPFNNKIKISNEFTFEEQEGLVIEENKVSYDHTGETPRTTFSEKVYSKGVHSWEVKVENTSNPSNIMVGVCISEKTDISKFLSRPTSWAYYGWNGKSFHDLQSITKEMSSEPIWTWRKGLLSSF